MAEANSDNQTCEENCKKLKDLEKDLERMIEQMEKMSIKTTWMMYEMVATRKDPALVDQIRRLDESFLQCKEEIKEKWKAMLEETKKTP
ncbi:synaptonemal complex central element protein 3 [Leptodactylus fuscus]|uniref:synaptonemal complex central element protein 3 n=1 Tax=Leptodactylus fuscus TaxID=238119 RepID=UPI003F4E7C71